MTTIYNKDRKVEIKGWIVKKRVSWATARGLLVGGLFACAGMLGTEVQARTVQGLVLSSNDSTAVVGADCRLLADGKFLSGTAADAQGGFILETEDRSPLTLEISMAGFSPTDILIEAGGKSLNLGKIYLDDAVMLEEVSVTANAVTHSKGRTIVYPSGADVKSSATSLALLQKLPLSGLLANPVNRTVSVDGGSPVILINGVPSTLEDFNALEPKDIEKIEYSRFTPARYADSGNSGFLNITLKKRNDGGQVYTWLRSAVTTAFLDANLKASYHQGPSQFSLQYTPSWRNYQDVYDDITESYIADDIDVNLNIHKRTPFYYHYHNVRLKYDFSPSAKTLFSATLSLRPNYNKSRSIAHTFDSAIGEYDNKDLNKGKDISPSLDLFLRQDFNDRNSMEVQVVGTLSSSDYLRENDYTFSNGEQESYKMDVDSRRRSLISEITYSHIFSEKTSLSGGYQNTLSHSVNKYLLSDYRPILTENNNYVYAHLDQSVGRVYFSLSTGAKLFWIHNDVNRRHYIRNLSSAYVQWNIGHGWNVKGAFRYTPIIPSLSILTDYPQQQTPYLASNGNPDLKVAERLYYSAGVDYTYRKFNASLLALYANTKNCFIEDVRYISNGLFLSQPINSRYLKNFETDLTLGLSDIHGFGANIYLQLSHYRDAGADWSHRLTSFSASFSLWWNKGPFTISYWRSIPGKTLYGHTVAKDENGDALQVEWKPNSHWTVGASWFYMFDKKGTRYPSWNYSSVNPSHGYRFITHNSNMVTLEISYTTNFGSLFRTTRRNLNNADSGSSLLRN